MCLIRRGRPYFPEKAVGEKIMDGFSELSSEFGTTITLDETGNGIVEIATKELNLI